MKITLKKKKPTLSKKLHKVSKALNLALSVAGICYSLYLLKPRFEKLEGIDPDKLEQVQKEKAESK